MSKPTLRLVSILGVSLQVKAPAASWESLTSVAARGQTALFGRARLSPAQQTRRGLLAGLVATLPDPEDSPTPELGSLVLLLRRYPGRWEAAELSLVCDPSDRHHRVMLQAIDHLIRSRQHVGGPWDTLPPITTTTIAVPGIASDAKPDVADREILAAATSSVFGEPGIEVYVAGTPGPSDHKHQLLNLALMAGVPTVFKTREGQLLESEPPPLRLSWAAAVEVITAAERDRDRPSRYLTEGRRNLLARELLHRAARADHLTSSAGASELEAHAAHLSSKGQAAAAADASRLAGALRGQVQSWVRQRLWSLNLVPEIVNHDDRHVMRVEHLVAQLASPLLRDGVIDAEDMYVLCCAAWLHDWGHVGAPLGRGFPTHSSDVRQLHGLLSRELIARNDTRVGLVAVGPLMPRKVGLLVAHHQSKTCCGDGRIDQGLLTAAARYGYAVTTLLDDLAHIEWDLPRVQLLLGLLRVADGLDLGQHRVPFAEPGPDAALEYLRNVARRVITWTRERVEVLSSDQQLTAILDDLQTAPLEDGFRQRLVEYTAATRENAVRKRAGQPKQEVVANYLDAPRPDPATILALATLPRQPGQDVRLLFELDRFVDYIDTVRLQPARYFPKHSSIIDVRLERDGQLWVPLVLAATEDTRKDAVEYVAEDLRRELHGDKTCALNVLGECLKAAGVRFGPPITDETSPTT